MATKSVMVSYNDLNKIVTLQSNENLETLKKRCVSLFKFGANVKLDIVFQKYDPDWDAQIDLCDDYLLIHKDKLKMVVQPLLNDESSVKSDVSSVADSPSTAPGTPSIINVSTPLDTPPLDTPSSEYMPIADAITPSLCKRPCRILGYDIDESCSVVSESSYTSDASEHKRIKLELPNVITKKQNL
jgi:hypothetical protein